MAATSVVHACRLCRAKVAATNSTALFTPFATSKKLPTRISDLLEVTIACSDGLVQTHICRQCRRRFDSLERAAADLKSFKILAKESRSSFLARSGEVAVCAAVKQTKECSGLTGISPPSKRQPLSRSLRQLNFEGILATQY